MKERVAEHTQRKYKQISLLAGTEQKRKNRNLMLQNVVFTGILVAVFFLLIGLILPEGCFYGSTIDWYDQHVTLAETIRRTCIEEKTLAPAWMTLGGGSNGFQFAYYGYFRPDIILGCLLPRVSMTLLIPVYALCSYLAAVLLMQLLASAGRSVSFLRIFRQYVVFAGKLLFPDTSSDHVCELFTVFASGTDFLKKEKICADVCQSDADLSAQFLLRDRLSGSNRLVCDRNAAQRSRLGRKAETSGAGSDQCRFIALEWQ